MSSPCNWPMESGRRCRQVGGRASLADLSLCWQHQRVLTDALRHVIYRPEDPFEEAIQDAAKGALSKFMQTTSARREVERQARTLVYFVERDGFVKIGYTTNLKQRIRAISSGSCLIEGMTVGPVQLLATIDGADRSNEAWLHQRFRHLRLGGEWFLLDDELRAFISGLKGYCSTGHSLREAA